jgi:hypothetical protein
MISFQDRFKGKTSKIGKEGIVKIENNSLIKNNKLVINDS